MARLTKRDIAMAMREPEFMRGSHKKHAPKAKKTWRAETTLSSEEDVDGQLRPPAGTSWIKQVPGGVPVRVWADDLEASAWRQISNVSKLPFLHPRGIALMPDVHAGQGACVGSVLPMRGVLVPSAVGCDIGCGMLAVKLDLTGSQLPDSLKSVRHAIEAAVPLGAGGLHREPVDADGWKHLEAPYQDIVSQARRVFKRNAHLQLGTLGSGNHFIELCLDERSQVWLMLHSGSRGAGSLIGQAYIEKALRRCQAEGIVLPDNGLGWFPEGHELFEQYRVAVLWAQDYARENRRLMLQLALGAVQQALGRRCQILGEAINCHHNYVEREHHFGEDLWVTRKGAIRAGEGELGIIPGSMGTESFIVRGKGCADAYHSCSHGAGRAMSRAQAREMFTAADLRKQTAGVECRKVRELVDEIPGAYKNIRHVMAQQQDLVDVVHTLRQVVCVKGS